MVPFLKDEHTRHMLALPFTLPFTLRRFYGNRLSLPEATASLRKELFNREERFLELARQRIYADRESPYARLLHHAGCSFADLAISVQQKGLETTLADLAREGVYLKPNEFKGKEDVVRNGLRFRVRPEALGPDRQRDAPAAFVSQSSGTNNLPTRSVTSLNWQLAETPATGVFLKAHGLLAHRHAVYEPMLAGVAAGIQFVLMYGRLGVPVERWFARPVPVKGWLEGAYFWTTAHEIALSGKWFGPGFGRPEAVGANELKRIVRWVEAHSQAGRSTCIRTVASNASRIARVAIEAGRSLAGCTFIASGEPVTTAKRRVIEQAGAQVTVTWGYEPGAVFVGLGCANPVHGDEMHVNQQCLAVIEHPDPIVNAGGERIRPLLFTSLYPSAARLQLNVSNGDYADLSERDCGCGLHKAGLTLHAHNVGSYEKLTCEGLAYPYQDLFELLEMVLPDDFGGGAGDYQLVEEEGPGGQTFLTLLVDPAAGAIDEKRLLERLGAELAKGSDGNRFMADVWRATQTLRLRREPPIASSRGKVLPLRVAAKVR